VSRSVRRERARELRGDVAPGDLRRHATAERSSRRYEQLEAGLSARGLLRRYLPRRQAGRSTV
jgi:hypothetical protein